MSVQLSLAMDKIKSISFNQNEIFQNIILLHNQGKRIHCDATYGHGVFYKKGSEPELRFDLEPKRPGVVQADSRRLPLECNTIDSLVFDPPFIITDHKDSEHYLMKKRYSGFKLISELRDMYSESIKEFARVLKPGGRLIIKCQDTTHGKKNYFIHNEVINMCDQNNFIALDLFILLNNNVFHGAIKQQRTARKHHSYFLVFKKRQRKYNK